MEHPKKIRILFTEPVSETGGVSSYILNIIKFLPKEKYEVYFLADGNGSMFDSVKEYGVTGISLPVDYHSAPSFFVAHRAFRKLYREYRFDIIQAHTAKAGFLVCSQFINVPVFYIGHGWRFSQKKSFLSSGLMYLFEQFICRRASYLIFESKKQIIEGLHVKLIGRKPHTAVSVSFNFDHLKSSNEEREQYRHNLLDQFSLSQNIKMVCMVGRIVEQKDPKTFVRVCKEIYNSFPEVHFVWVGDGNLRRPMEEFAAELGVSNRLHIMGMQTSDKARSVLLGSDILLFTSLFEGLPVTILEAFALKVPIIAADVGSISDVVIDKKTGRLFPKENFHVAAKLLSEALREKNCFKEYAMAGYTLVSERYSPEEKMSLLFQQLYVNQIRK